MNKNADITHPGGTPVLTVMVADVFYSIRTYC